MARAPDLLPIESPSSRLSALRGWLTGTLAGRALMVGALIKIVALAVAAVSGRSAASEAIDTTGDIGLVFGAVVLGYQLFVDAKRRVLWRVRRKLTLSYIFIGFVPAFLIIVFFVITGVLLLNNMSSYVILSRVKALVDETQFLAQGAALGVEDARTQQELRDSLARRQVVAAARYPEASYTVVPVARRCGSPAPQADQPARLEPVVAGAWAHVEAPASVPAWVPCGGYAGLILYLDNPRRAGDRVPGRLAARAVAWPDDNASFAVIVDVPITRELARRLREDTGVALGNVTVIGSPGNTPTPAAPPAPDEVSHDNTDASLFDDDQGASSGLNLLRRPTEWVAFFDAADWPTGQAIPVTMAIRTSVADIYDRIAPVERVGNFSVGQLFLLLLSVVAGLLLVIQVVAFLMGLGLARSITGSVHELFVGTERVRRGDFTHKIAIRSRDQLGELAKSFNSMTGSIEDLLQQKAEKERLEQELRIARSIQMSLLPQGPFAMPGFTLTAHCEPAREVGGDYYDYLPIDADRMGILIADVSGKGTSAALYMAVLKGIVLSLSQVHASPRDLLIDANRIISRHLDARSFITATYAVVDLRARTLRYARAGHCPLIYMPGRYADSRAAQILTPDGMVVGLQLDEGEMFTHHLEEATLPLGRGDLFLLYTDGITEAMNIAGDCFGDLRLADLVADHADVPSDELRERILRDIRAFAGATAQQDDMTMVLLKVDEEGGPAASASLDASASHAIA